ncbi:MAG: glycosyltransferase, partial [Phycisphaerae bacterium]
MTRRLSIMLDARMLVGRFSGVGRVVTRLIDELTKQDDLRIIALCGRDGFPPWEGRRDIETMTSTFGRKDRTAVRRLVWEETHLRKLIRRAKVDLFHATWNTGVPARCPVPCVLTIHDLIPWQNPRSYFTNVAQRFCYQRAVRASTKRAAYITTVSDYVRKQVLTTLCVDHAKVVTIPNGVTIPPSNLRKTDQQPPPYALYVGGYGPRKNVAAVFAAMYSYWRRFGPTVELR